MSKGRLEAFSDGVLAIIITIMVLELQAPHEATLEALRPLAPKFLSYVLSFVFLAIYWNNHHHLWQAVQQINGAVMWANMHLLFWLSLIPFTTAWMGENDFAHIPVAVYGLILWLAAVAYTVMVRVLLACHEKDSALAAAIGNDFKGWLSLACYTAAVPLAFVTPMISLVLYATVTVIWFVPDRRVERSLRERA
jgi:uncharacterized membrane protein